MKLTDLHPEFFNAGGPGIHKTDGSPVPARVGVGMIFDCPCGCGVKGHVEFTVAIDGQPWAVESPRWERTGDTFETMTLSPSINRPKPQGCGWHGWIRNGEVTKC